ncbi:hypothetical protein [Micromonospora craterilacus]|uniref:hypothetical protein n=1 Tax=Micromonospora craterilacus TaxID=1655439 RepID=UPI001F21182E|nr:hypothetical protein [Micromonospora craterilacus]
MRPPQQPGEPASLPPASSTSSTSHSLREQIAETIGRSGRTVSRIAKELGLKFDREKTRAATEAKVADARAKRAARANDLLDDAARLRRQLWQPAHYVDHGGKEYDRVDWTLDEPPVRQPCRRKSSM